MAQYEVTLTFETTNEWDDRVAVALHAVPELPVLIGYLERFNGSIIEVLRESNSDPGLWEHVAGSTKTKPTFDIDGPARRVLQLKVGGQEAAE